LIAKVAVLILGETDDEDEDQEVCGTGNRHSFIPFTSTIMLGQRWFVSFITEALPSTLVV